MLECRLFCFIDVFDFFFFFQGQISESVVTKFPHMFDDDLNL